MLQSRVVRFETLIWRPGFLGLEAWLSILSLHKGIHVKAKSTVLFKQASDVVETLALLVNVRFCPGLYVLGLDLLCNGILLEIRRSLNVLSTVFVLIIDTLLFPE